MWQYLMDYIGLFCGKSQFSKTTLSENPYSELVTIVSFATKVALVTQMLNRPLFAMGLQKAPMSQGVSDSAMYIFNRLRT
jgi:hypothetical protein